MKYKSEELAEKRPSKSLNLMKYNPGFDMNIGLDHNLKSLSPFLKLNR